MKKLIFSLIAIFVLTFNSFASNQISSPPQNCGYEMFNSDGESIGYIIVCHSNNVSCGSSSNIKAAIAAYNGMN